MDSVCSSGQLLRPVLEALKPWLVQTLAELVKIPSENLPPRGNESACQGYVADCLRGLGLEPDVYEIHTVAGLAGHPEYWTGRDYTGRPNVNARLRGTGGGRSLILSGHIDTVPADTPAPWTVAPFGGVSRDGRLYGRGAWDMKCGVAMNLAVLRALREAGVRLKGDLIFETVVDEEYGGVNGTLAGRLRGYMADAAVITEPTALRICPAQHGGTVVHIQLAGDSGMLRPGLPAATVVDQLAYLLPRVPEFAQLRERTVAVHPLYVNAAEPFAVWITNIATGRWGWTQPIAVPQRCSIEFYWQTMPQETGEQAKTQFLDWWKSIVAARPDLFARAPEVEFPMRWLPGSAISPDEPLVREFSAATAAHGLKPVVEGLDAPSDMYMFQKCFSIPALMWGPAGANAHLADEYVEIESLYQAARVLLGFVSRWCGLEPERT